MKKIDLHIHTVPNKYLDSTFMYDSVKMKEYVIRNGFDIIAITNHNLFDLNNFRIIKKDLKNEKVTVFPGIEISLENGHILVIGDDTDEVYNILSTISSEIAKNENSDQYKMSVKDFNKLCCGNNFLIIPHYRKAPSISEEYLDLITDEILNGEVSSPKSFYSVKKNDKYIPVYFSDIRIGRDLSYFQNSSRFTYINCDSSNFLTLKNSLSQKNCVELNRDSLEEEFEILNGTAMASSGINVLVGKRSSGKTFTLNRIYEENKDKSLYIKQFEITENCSDNEFAKTIKNNEQQTIEDFFYEMLQIMDYIDFFDADAIKNDVDEYISTLKLYAQQSINDSFSKLSLFNYDAIDIKDIEEVKGLVKSLDTLLSSSDEYELIINKYISKENRISLYNELVLCNKLLYKHNKKVDLANKITKEISGLLGVKSSVIQVKNIKLKDYFKLNYIKKKFNDLIKNTIDKEINSVKILNKFEKKINVMRQTNKTKLKSNLGAPQQGNINYLVDKNPFDAYVDAKSDDNISNRTGENRYKFFFDYEVKIVNETNNNISGGQKAEYTLLNKLTNYQKYDFVLIDEMEASFDNPFLNDEVIKIIKTMASKCTIFISTHNNNLGVSLMPDYYIYHSIESDSMGYNYIRYYGKSNEKYLKNCNSKTIELSKVLIDTMEANQKAYEERGHKYENFND